MTSSRFERDPRNAPAVAVDLGELRGWVAAEGDAAVLEELARHWCDPSRALRTLHWGRNYLYLSEGCGGVGSPEHVVVKQFRNQGLRKRLRRRLKGSKAEQSWRVARALSAAQVPTPRPLALLEAKQPDGPSFFVSEFLAGVFEARYFFRALAAGREGELFPAVDPPRFLGSLGKAIRRLHDAGFWHRDLSTGNLLVQHEESAEDEFTFYLVDLNRTRGPRRLTTSERTRDLCRLPIGSVRLRRLFLAAYWGSEPTRLRRALYELDRRAFLAKNRWKAVLRRPRSLLRALLFKRQAHAHIPPPPPGADKRDKSVWDKLSDQPHQHAGRFERLIIRAADLPVHAQALTAMAMAAPRIRRRYRELAARRYSQPVPFGGVGLALRPPAQGQDDVIAALDQLGVRKLLLRLHPWEDDHHHEEALARELTRRGYELAFALPQNRQLVRDPSRWRAALDEIGERFTPLGRHFQIGQAINRSKWGVWNGREYLRLASIASEVLRRSPEIELLGPAVIDFELHITAGILNLRRAGVHFDAVASLLYVDRRGAPENSQLGFDTVGKVTLLKAIAETARNSAGRSWITEVNWPLWEGPHAPAGRKVAVDEEAQADYLVRYYLLTLCSGMVERVYWWQLVARGYGLMVGEEGSLRRRPSFRALAHLNRRLAGATSLGPIEAPGPIRLYRFAAASGADLVVAWSLVGEVEAALPAPATAVFDRDGAELAAPPSPTVTLGPSPRYFVLS